MAKKTNEDKNRMKPHWEVQFVAENMVIQTLALMLSQSDGVMPPDDVIDTLMESCVRCSIYFNNNKHRWGIDDRVTDSLLD